MESSSESLMGLLTPGKRVYRAETGQVSREEFQASQLIHTMIYGEKGLADTLGPTWEMIHDPRFEKLEHAFIRDRRSVFGGDSSVGKTRQLQDGSFNTSLEDLNQYAEILGEGRYFHQVLRSMSYHRAISELYPEREFAIPRKEYLPGIFIFNQLTAEEQTAVGTKAAEYAEFYPSNLYRHSDDALWALIQQECPNYFNRHGKMNQTAKYLFGMLRADLVGLIGDYAEVAKLQEWVLLDNEHTLVEKKHIDEEAPRVWAEVEMLERALTLRAELRKTASDIMKMIGVDGLVRTTGVDLTEFEREHLLKLIYQSNFPDDRPELISKIHSYLLGIKFAGQTTEQRSAEQCRIASSEAKAYVAKLKSGEVQPINRESDGVEDIELSDDEKIAEEILTNPLKQFVFLRLSSTEGRIQNLRNRVFSLSEQITDAHAALETEEQMKPLLDERTELLEKIERLSKVVAILAPVFETIDFPLTEESAAELLGQTEEFDSTLVQSAVVEGDPGQSIAAPALPDLAT